MSKNPGSFENGKRYPPEPRFSVPKNKEI